MSLLLPEGVDSLVECPFTLHEAILNALRIIRYEEFPKDERPPRRIWMDGEKLTAWWEEVEHRRDAKYKSDTSDTPVDGAHWEENAVELIERG